MSFEEAVITGIATGIGCAIGTYIASRGVIRNIEKAEEKLRGIKDGLAGKT